MIARAESAQNWLENVTYQMNNMVLNFLSWVANASHKAAIPLELQAAVFQPRRVSKMLSESVKCILRNVFSVK